MDNLMEQLIEDFVSACQDFCDDNDIDVSVEIDNDFGYYKNEKIVGITLITDRQAKYFMANAFNNGLAYDCGDFIISFLHEIGHHYTLNTLTKKQIKKINLQKARLRGWSKKDNFKYFNFLDEVLATKWAIDYVNNNREIIKDFAETLMKIMNNYIREE